MLTGDWGDIIDKAETERFIGREYELDLFQRQIALTPPRSLIFYITGQGGVGKTTLLNQYREMTRNLGFLLADCNELQHDVPAVLGRFAQQFTEQNAPLKRFDERYKVYRQKMQEIEADPEAPQGLAALLGRTVVRVTYMVGDAVPGIRKGLEYFPQKETETQVSDWASYLAKKLTNKDEIALVRDPEPVLTSLFFQDVNQLAQKQRILLCFENFEATRQELQAWLLRLREYKPSQNIRIAIAGRDPLSAQWDSLRSVTKVISLDVFTEQEAEAFLDTYEITDIKRRAEILECSGRLPVIMSWLAAPQGNDPDPSIPAHDIVERFLRWVTEPAWRQVALLAAIPRMFNADILKPLLGHNDPTINEQAAFEWLQAMPFVQTRPDGWRYHPIVRRMMLHYQRQKSPSTYRKMHEILADFYSTKRSERHFPDGEEWSNEQWRKETLAYMYHFLVADPTQHWEETISLFTVAVRKRRSFATEIIEMLHEDNIHDELHSKQRADVQLFRKQLQAIKQGSLQDGFEMFDRLCAMTNLSPQAMCYTFAYRGECYRLEEKNEKALLDFGEALHYFPEDAWAIASRGQTYQAMKRYEEALVDFDRAITLDEENDWIYDCRGETYRMMERYEEALADFDRAIALDEKYTWAIANRGETYRLMKRYEEALADFDRAIALGENYDWAIASRGETYRLMKRYEEALADFNRAITLDENYGWAIASRGETYRMMKRYEEALADFDRAIALNEKSDWYRYCRAQIYFLIHQIDVFENDLNVAIELALYACSLSSDEAERWRLDFNRALYHLFSLKQIEAQSLYTQFIAACTLLPRLQGALMDVGDLLKIQPQNELAQQVAMQLRQRIAALEQS